MNSKSPAVSALSVDRLYRPVDPAGLPFQSTAELAPVEGLVGQGRALDAIRFGTGIDKPGFNLFVIGQPDARMRETVRSLLQHAAKEQRRPSDWVYVNNFKEPHKPVAIEMPAGRAPEFRAAMQELIDDLKAALPAVFNSEEYQTRRGAIDEAFQKRQGEAFSELQAKATAKSIAILRTPLGFALAPMRNGEVIPPAEFNAWPEEKRKETQETIAELERELEQIMRRLPQWEKERRDDIRTLNQETARVAVDQSVEEVKGKFSGLATVAEHLEHVRTDLIENVGIFIMKGEEGERPNDEGPAGGPFDRYQVNVLVSQADHEGGAPVVEEQHATLQNLIGRVEHVARQGVLITNFRLIKPGALHRANGGYLLLDVRSVLTEAFAWPALKRALRRREIVIEDVGRLIGLSTTVSLEPDPIPLDLKVVLFGDRLLYFLLAAYDPELNEHFKVLADFEDDIDRSPESERVLGQLVAAIVRRENLKPMDRDAVALVIERAARIAGHSGKLSLLTEQIRDLLAEADFWAGQAGRATVTGADVRQATDRKIERASRLRDRMQEMILQKVALIDTAGERIGQLNGLSVIELGGFAFGRPSRITCQVRPGTGKVVDIEREVELGGPIHSKGVLILSGFLAGRFALDTPMSLYASLVFEQSYSGVEGDSASSAELYTMLSALADAPLRQDLAVTGSVNQHGEVQAIGGVNEKIEGFFDICEKRGLTGTQGVLIPEANVQHLMLRNDVVEACAAGRFAVYPIATIDQGIALLTGREAGVRGADGRYPGDSIYGRVEDRLRAFAAVRRSFATSVTPEGNKS
ncbi:MAG: AAA family ATPase [Bradyrhizobiaceae bacterium]|nr:AAA family ATPase [Bradyrhizobiaceae bacterium]